MSVVWMGLLAAALFAVMVAVLVHASYPWMRIRLERLPPRLRARVAFTLLAAPLALGTALSLLAVLPGVAAPLAPTLDHCMEHGDHHFHLCLVHGPTGIDFSRLGVVLGVLSAPFLIRLAFAATRLLRGHRLLSALRRTARPTAASYEEIASEAPFAVTAGLWRPQVYVTTGLLQLLDSTSRRAVLAHEAAHVRRRDPLMKLLAELCSAFHLPGTRAALVADHSLYCELACDEAAAVSLGDRTAVADALVKLGRLVSDCTPTDTPAVAHFGEGRISTRVHALLDAPKPRPRLPSTGVTVTASLMLAVLLSAPLHHVTETVLGTFFG